MIKPIDNIITVDKYHNIVKGRRVATEQSIKGLKKVDTLYKELDNIPEDELSSYYRENLPELIEKLKETYQLNLDIIDIELNPNEDDAHDLYDVKDELEELLGKKVTKSILKALNNSSVTEDKLHNVVKSREMAYEDCDWILTKIEELEGELTRKEEGTSVKRSWAKRAASQNQK
ncbi:hypothetical protein [Tenacibaculum sp. 190524A02b]|uniref:hypothetical protein n=1 Tax=Tenacibaculum vairaonense TaxID=3137860 RepID=UPI0032B25929